MICTRLRPFKLRNNPVRDCFVTLIDGKDYWECIYGKFYSERPDTQFTRGFIGKGAAIMGKFGEQAFGHATQTKPNLGYIHGGDKHDFVLAGKGIDVKTTNTKAELVCVIVETDRGWRRQLRDDFYVACFLRQNRRLAMAHVVTYGFFSRREVAALPTVPGRGGDRKHKNKELYLDKSRPILDLIAPLGERGVEYVKDRLCGFSVM